MKNIVDLNDLMLEQLHRVDNGERKLNALLVEMLEHIKSADLKTIVSDYLKKNEDQIIRLDQVFALLFASENNKDCEVMISMIDEAQDLMKRSSNAGVRDAGIISSLQHIIHYKMASYGAVCTYAQMLDLDNVAEIIHLNLEDEKVTDQELIVLAEKRVNFQAV